MNLKKPWPNVKYKYLIEEEMPHPLSQEQEAKHFIYNAAASEHAKFNCLLNATVSKYIKWPWDNWEGEMRSPRLENAEELFEETIELVASLYTNIDIHHNVSVPYVIMPGFSRLLLYHPRDSDPLYLFLPHFYALGQLSELKKNVSEMEDKLGEKK